MLNYPVERSLLEPLVPAGLELDHFAATFTYVSVRASSSSVCRFPALPLPFHRNFEEVNLRFYVRRFERQRAGAEESFSSERLFRDAPSRFSPGAFYGEPYSPAFPMSHALIEHDQEQNCGVVISGSETDVRNLFLPRPPLAHRRSSLPSPACSFEEFITEHYWGYTGRRGACGQYQIEHPPWKIWNADQLRIRRRTSQALYGEQFVETLNRPRPRSAFHRRRFARHDRASIDFAATTSQLLSNETLLTALSCARSARSQGPRAATANLGMRNPRCFPQLRIHAD